MNKFNSVDEVRYEISRLPDKAAKYNLHINLVDSIKDALCLLEKWPSDIPLPNRLSTFEDQVVFEWRKDKSEKHACLSLWGNGYFEYSMHRGDDYYESGESCGSIEEGIPYELTEYFDESKAMRQVHRAEL